MKLILLQFKFVLIVNLFNNLIFLTMGTPTNLISIQKFKEGVDNYKKGISVENEKSQTRSVWFSLQDLKEFLEYVEKNASTKEIKVSGIRFHLTAEKGSTERVNLALCPTFENINSKKEIEHLSFDPLYSEKGKPVTIHSLMNDTSKAISDSSILNQGISCPFLCPEIE